MLSFKIGNSFERGKATGMASDGILEVTDGNFDQAVLKSDQPVMVDFWAAWCGPCKALAPIVDEVAAAYNGKVKVGKMDVDRNPSTPQRYGVRGIPTLLIFKNGQVQEQIVGYVARDVIEKALNKHVNG
jgi:thioredoxin 1